MQRLLANSLTDAREYFSGEMKTVFERQKISADGGAFDYLVGLLVRYIQSKEVFVEGPDGKPENHSLVELYSKYVYGDAATKRWALQRLGDVSLFIAGFFPDSLKRKAVDIDYYHGMGESAYWQLARHMPAIEAAILFKELALKFKSFSGVFSELSERTGLQTNTDLLRLYEKWLLTGSDRLQGLLKEHGIAAPVFSDTKARH